jgi:hypothetical protein
MNEQNLMHPGNLLNKWQCQVNATSAAQAQAMAAHVARMSRKADRSVADFNEGHQETTVVLCLPNRCCRNGPATAGPLLIRTRVDPQSWSRHYAADANLSRMAQSRGFLDYPAKPIAFSETPGAV